MAALNVQTWSVEQVVDWISGLDPQLASHAQSFASSGITGQKLLTLMTGDLEYSVGIKKIGDQLVIHDAIQTLRDELSTPWTTLQTLSLSLSVRCKNYRSELTQQKQKFQDALEAEYNSHHHEHHHHHHHYHHDKSSRNNTHYGMDRQGGSGGGGDRGDRGGGAIGGGGSSSSGGMNSNSCGGSSRVNSSSSNNNSKKLETIPTSSLASASYLLDAGKVLIRWLTRFPFLGKLNYDEISRKLTKHCFELAVLSQRDSFADNAIEEVQYLCTKIIELTEVLINSTDSLVIQPAGVDIITLRKRNEQDWGLLFDSTPWGIHQITGCKLSSPAQQSGNLERGDEILQVNYQTVLAWPMTHVINLLHENENEVIVTVKRRPRHASTNLLLIGGHQNNMYLNKVPNRKSFFERRAREEVRARALIVQDLSGGGVGVGSSSSNNNVMGVMMQERDDDLRERGDVESGGIIGGLIVVEDVQNEKKNKKKNKNKRDDEEEELSSSLDDGGSGSNVVVVAERSEARFWKLYPRPKCLIRRRATVTGASPTETRPPVTFIHEQDSSNNTIPSIINNDSSSESTASTTTTTTTTTTTRTNKTTNNPHPQVHHRRSTPVHGSSTHNNTNSSNLLNPPFVQRPPLDKSRSAPEEDTGQVVDDDDDETGQQQQKKKEQEQKKKEEEQNTHEIVCRKPKTSVNKGDDFSVINKNHDDDDDDKRTGVKICDAELSGGGGGGVFIIDDDEVFEKPVEVLKKNEETQEMVTPPTPKPRLLLSSSNNNNDKKVLDNKPTTTSTSTTPQPITILYKGILHIRSQLRKQSSSNSSTALPVIGGSTSALSNLLVSGSPRWIRQSAVFWSNRELEIVNNVGGGMSSSGGGVVVERKCGSVSSSTNMQQCFKVLIGVDHLDLKGEEFGVFCANEVHSRPFAFKITNSESLTYYLAAESQVELESWLNIMTSGSVKPPTINTTTTTTTSVSSSTSLTTRAYGLTTIHPQTQDKRNSYGNTRAPYKRSISLGSSQSPTISSNTNLSTIPNTSSSSSSSTYGTTTLPSTPPPPSRVLHHHHQQILQPHDTRVYYGSSSNLLVYSSPKQYGTGSSSQLRSTLNRSKSSSLKTDWFLRSVHTPHTPPPTTNTTQPSNISSITITSKKITKTHQNTQYPSACSTPTKTIHPVMGMGMMMKMGAGNNRKVSSPTKKYACPNCCNIVRVDMGTQTDEVSVSGGGVHVFFNNEEESSV